MNKKIKFETDSAIIIREYLVRVQIPTGYVDPVLASIVAVTPLQYGKYEHVVFRYTAGTQQFKPMEGSHVGEIDLIHISTDEISFTLPSDDSILCQVIEAIFSTHPYEEPVIYIQETLSTRFKYGSGKDNPNKWWETASI